MLKIRRNRSNRRNTQRIPAVALTTAGLLAILASPAQGLGENDDAPPEESSRDPELTATAAYTGNARPATASNCTVQGYQGNGYYYVFEYDYAEDSDQEDKLIEGVIKDSDTIEDPEEPTTDREEVVGEDGANTDANPALIDPDEDGPDADGDDLDAFLTELEDGKFDVDGSEWGVWHVYCGDKDKPDEEDFSIVSAPLSPAGLILPALDVVHGYLPKPELSLEPFDETNGWTYVQAPIDFRTTTETLQPITITADTGGPEEIRQWITITATPDRVIFDSGDTETNPSTANCAAAAADDIYIAETPGDCSYTYRNSSSITDDNLFETELSITWTVESIDSDGVSRTLAVEPTTQRQDVAVAEVKAVNVYDE